MVAGGFNPRNMATNIHGVAERRMDDLRRIPNDRESIVAPRHNESWGDNPGLERPGYHQMPLRGQSQLCFSRSETRR